MPQTEAAACPKHIDLYAVAPHHHALTRAMLGHGGSWGGSGHGACWGMGLHVLATFMPQADVSCLAKPTPTYHL